MNTNPKFSEKEFDAEISKLLQAESQAKAPAFFTEKVMSGLRQENPAIGYKPVISKWAWAGIGFFILIITGFAIQQPSSSAKTLFTLPKLTTPPLLQSIGHWLSNFTLGGWQTVQTSGLVLPLVALFLTLSLHFILLNGFHFTGKNKTDKMYCL